MMKKFNTNEKGIFEVVGTILILTIIVALIILPVYYNESSNNITFDRTRSALVVDSNFQLLVPMKEWDWDVQSSGYITQEQFELCDHIPQSCEPYDQFTSSSQSFSDNYRAFLYALDPEFQPNSLLENAKSNIRIPNGTPSESHKPRGWTIVRNDDGIDRWQPYWSISNQPRDWRGINGGNGGTIKIPVNTLGSKKLIEFLIGDKVFQLIVTRPSKVQNIEIYAEAWDRIQIYPGDWYDSGMIKLGSKGPFLPGYVENIGDSNDTNLGVPIFGPRGLFCCRISELVVAYKPCLIIDVNDSLVTQDREKLMNATELQIAGFVLNKSGSGNVYELLKTKKNDAGTTYYYCSTSPRPVIVGVIIEKINPASWG